MSFNKLEYMDKQTVVPLDWNTTQKEKGNKPLIQTTQKNFKNLSKSHV